MALAFVQGVSSTGTAGTSPQAAPAFGSSIAPGDLIVVLAGGDGGTTGLATSLTDTYGNTYIRAPSFDIANAGGTLNLDCFYAIVTVGGANNIVSLTFNDSGENCVLVVQHFNGFTGTPTFDKKSTSSNASSTTCTSGATAATTVADEVVIGLGIHASTVSAFSLGSGYTNLTQASVANRQAAMESKVVAATGAQTATFTIAAARVNIGGVVTFYDAAAGTPTLAMPLISSAVVLYAPTITTGAVAVAAPLITNSNTLYAPSLAMVLNAPIIASTTVLYSPTITPPSQAVSLPFISSTSSMYAPTVVRIIVPVSNWTRENVPTSAWQPASNPAAANWSKETAPSVSWQKEAAPVANWQKETAPPSNWQ